MRYLRETLIKKPLQQISLGQCIVNVTRPRSSIPPIPFGLGVESVLRYKQSVTENEDITDYLKANLAGSFTY